MPRDLWRWRVDANQIADLTDADRLVTVGLTTPRPTQREWLAFQKLGEQLWRDGYRGVLAPSAARPEKRILCLFREVDDVPDATPVRPALKYRRPPAPPTGMAT